MHQVTHCPLQTTHRQRDKNNSRRRVSTQGLLSFIQVVFGTEPLNRALFVLYEKFQQHCQQAVKCRKLYWLTGKYIQTGFFAMYQDLCTWSQHICDRALQTHSMSLPPSLSMEIYCATHLDFNNCNTLCSVMLCSILELVLLVFLISTVFFNLCVFCVQIFVLIWPHICKFLYFLVFVKALGWQRHQGGRQGKTWR